MRCAAVLVALLVATALAAELCLTGTAPLAVGASAPQEGWCNSADCTLTWALTFDTVTVGAQRWPLTATVNGTALTTLYPALTDVGIQCSTSGEIIATTATAVGGQRLRLVWTYAGVQSFSCAYMLSSVDLESDFRNFQALLAYSGHISTFDATFSSQAFAYSIADQQVACPAPEPGTSTGEAPLPAGPCVIGGCRHTPAAWRSLPHSPVWASVVGAAFCSLSYQDIINAHGGARFMPMHWLQEAQQLAAADLNAHLYGCALPTSTDAAIASSFAYLSNQLNCALNGDRSNIVGAVADWNDGELVCAQEAGAAASHGSAHADSTSKETSYLIWAIVMTVLFVAAVMLLLLLVMLFGSQLLAMVSGGASASGVASLGTELSMWQRLARIGDGYDDDASDRVPIATAYRPQPPPPTYSLPAPDGPTNAHFYGSEYATYPYAPPPSSDIPETIVDMSRKHVF
jgi:hypothetical protein